MKDGVILFLVCVVVIACIGMWSSGVDPFQALPTPTLRSEPWVVEADPTRAPGPQKTKPASSKAPQATLITPAEPSPVAVPQPVPVATANFPEVAQPITPPAPPVVRAKEFPVAEQIQVGTRKTLITDQYGQPSLVTTTKSNDGRVVENLVYSKAGGDRETVIRIEDGKVLSAYSR
jgi:hypothetical protein